MSPRGLSTFNAEGRARRDVGYPLHVRTLSKDTAAKASVGKVLAAMQRGGKSGNMWSKFPVSQRRYRNQCLSFEISSGDILNSIRCLLSTLAKLCGTVPQSHPEPTTSEPTWAETPKPPQPGLNLSPGPEPCLNVHLACTRAPEPSEPCLNLSLGLHQTISGPPNLP